MKKLIFIFIMLFLTFFKTWAHPLDISSTSGSFKENEFRLTTFFHTYEIEYLLNKNDKIVKNTYDYFNYKEIISKYVKSNIFLNIENNICKFGNFELIEAEEYEILTYGLQVNYKFICENIINNGEIKINFFSNFPLQTNQLSLYDLNNQNGITSFKNLVLNNDFNNYFFDLNNKEDGCVVDSDGDGLSDDLERLYKTDPFNIDTDGDFYTDYEEINLSFSPIDKNLGPGQIKKTIISKNDLEKYKNNIVTQKQCDEFFKKNGQINKQVGLLSGGFGNNYFVQTLKKISIYLNNSDENNIFFILLIVVGLGFIHASGPGHAKSLLVSYIIDKNKTFLDGFIFILIFTITHLLDIILLFLVTKVIFGIYDISNYMLYVQRISLIILIIFSFYLIFKSIKYFGKNIDKSQKDDKKSSILLGFISGLAPCTFGWSIFLLLFGIGNIYLIIPMLLALGLGIFLFLLILLIIVYFLRIKYLERIDIFSKYSSLMSSIVLLILSIILILKLY